MNIDFTKEQLDFLLTMVNTLNYPGSEIEKVLEVKNKIIEAINIVSGKVSDKKVDLTQKEKSD